MTIEESRRRALAREYDHRHQLRRQSMRRLADFIAEHHESLMLTELDQAKRIAYAAVKAACEKEGERSL